MFCDVLQECYISQQILSCLHSILISEFLSGFRECFQKIENTMETCRNVANFEKSENPESYQMCKKKVCQKKVGSVRLDPPLMGGPRQ